jgi:capsid protein
MAPGKTYYVRKGSNIRPFDGKYEGSDFEAFTTALLQAVCAAFGPGIPWQFALQQLTKSNMASARAALMQAWRSFRREQIDHEHELRIVVKNYIAEDLARGRLVLPTGNDLDAACAGYFIPPQRLTTDDSRELEAATKKRQVLGISRSTLAREYGGYDIDDEMAQDAEDSASDTRTGNKDASFVRRVQKASEAIKASGVSDLAWPIVLAAEAANTAPGAFISALSRPDATGATAQPEEDTAQNPEEGEADDEAEDEAEDEETANEPVEDEER